MSNLLNQISKLGTDRQHKELVAKEAARVLYFTALVRVRKGDNFSEDEAAEVEAAAKLIGRNIFADTDMIRRRDELKAEYESQIDHAIMAKESEISIEYGAARDVQRIEPVRWVRAIAAWEELRPHTSTRARILDQHRELRVADEAMERTNGFPGILKDFDAFVGEKFEICPPPNSAVSYREDRSARIGRQEFVSSGVMY